MKKLYFLFAACAVPVLMTAQDISSGEEYAVPFVWEEVYATKVSPNGRYVVGQDKFMNCYCFDTETEAEFFYPVAIPGDCRTVSDNGVFIGYDALTYKAVLMKNGQVSTPQLLKPYPLSVLNSITPDGRRATGWLNDTGKIIYEPMYCDLDSKGNVTKVTVLPHPERDFFGDYPQGYVMHVISDDGKTIAGIVTDGSGMYNYPIIYNQAEDGSWDYILPTKKLFNPMNLPLPEFPNQGEPPAQPRMDQFIKDEDRAQLWREYQAIYDKTNDADYYPWNQIPIYEDEYAAFNRAIQKFLDDYDVYLEAVDEYWRQMHLLGVGQNFGGYQFMSSDGSLMITLRGGQPYYFQTNSDDFQMRSVRNSSGLTPYQLLQDGTILAVSSENAFFPYTSYILGPEENQYKLFTDFIKENYPQVYPWIEDNIGQYGVIGYEGDEPLYGNYIISGVMSVSDDFSTICGGLPIGDLLSYVFYTKPTVEPENPEGPDSPDENGIDAIVPDAEGLYHVFSTTGVLLLTTHDESTLEALPSGIYIINSTKIVK